MRSSKDRTIQKKRVNKANKIAKTERSRKQRIANKHKREEIHAIDPDMKVIVMNQKTFDQYGTEIKIVDGAIKAVEPEIITELADFDGAVEEYKAEIDGGRAINDQIEKERLYGFKAIADRFRKK